MEEHYVEFGISSWAKQLVLDRGVHVIEGGWTGGFYMGGLKQVLWVSFLLFTISIDWLLLQGQYQGIRKGSAA